MEAFRKAFFYCCLGHPDNFEEDVLVSIYSGPSVITHSGPQVDSIITQQIAMKEDKKVDSCTKKKIVMWQEEKWVTFKQDNPVYKSLCSPVE